MPRKATRGRAVLDDPKSMPAWKRQSVDRSLQSARARASERSDRFVAATIDLMREKGSTDFTVQDVVDRSKMSIRTFYNFFASKDDLLVAVHETVLLTEVVPRLRARIEVESDPIQRLRAYIDNLFDLSALTEPVARALTTYYNRLAESRPAELDRAFKPQVDLVVELVENATHAGVLQSDLSTDKAAHLLFHTVLAAVHARILGSGIGGEISADDLWQFCAHGLGARTG
jgi:AcrR family transcriptional regulator